MTKQDWDGNRGVQLQIGPWILHNGVCCRICSMLSQAEAPLRRQARPDGILVEAAATSMLCRYSLNPSGATETVPPAMSDQFKGSSYLPAVIILRHDWSLAATTQDVQKTITWLDRLFGSTRDPSEHLQDRLRSSIPRRVLDQNLWPCYRNAVLYMRRQDWGLGQCLT
ncbi:hypothetical protein CONLIGDRAFT_141750 [Coniochaeta ligniaria NRRL 30616]|uniref:Uncharacterized protein n=1 Tax=Coniochaeta ligniaria NRRL 30616 TaxID=1408157 RepID=A0A1J7J048_9PEZI|nr:hypothetical protein CONLIGDRAFT_141750 [Coniochaeta ligniaria NRRL 30616]